MNALDWDNLVHVRFFWAVLLNVTRTTTNEVVEDAVETDCCNWKPNIEKARVVFVNGPDSWRMKTCSAAEVAGVDD